MSAKENKHWALAQMIPPMLAAHGLEADDCCAVIFAALGVTINQTKAPLEDKIVIIDQLEKAFPALRRQIIESHWDETTKGGQP